MMQRKHPQLAGGKINRDLQLENRRLIADNAKFGFRWLHYHGGITCNFVCSPLPLNVSVNPFACTLVCRVSEPDAARCSH